jgi:hypothetical protein
VDVISAVIARPVEDCWRAFTSPQHWIYWVTGLQVVRVLETTPEGLPREVHFEYAGRVSYVLRYSYDVEAKVVRWGPRPSARGGVRGFARFEPQGRGTRIVYAVEQDGTRTSLESLLDDSRAFVDAFAASMQDGS